MSDAAWLAKHQGEAEQRGADEHYMRVPKRSLASPQPKAPRPMTMKLTVMALEMPARDQPVAVDSGSRNTASENIAPMATQDISAPTATITQRYESVMITLPTTVQRMRSLTRRCGYAASRKSPSCASRARRN